MVGLCYVERGGALMHKHFQMVFKGNFSGLSVLNKKMKVCLGQDEDLPTNHVILCKRLTDEGLHTFKGMVEYCMKDNGRSIF